WFVPYEGSTSVSFSVGLDPLSAFFVLGAFLHGALSSVAGTQYLFWYKGRKPLGVASFFHCLMIAAMIMVPIARNGLLFLISWEVMAVAPFFLITFEDEREAVRAAGRTYLIATHLGTAVLLAFFLLVAKHAHSLDFL